MLELLENDSQRMFYRRTNSDLNINGPPDRLNLTVLEWSKEESSRNSNLRMDCVRKLTQRPQRDVRIIFTEPDGAGTGGKGQIDLFFHLGVPTDFLRERNEGSPSACGIRCTGDGRHCLWLHLLSKHIALDADGRIMGHEGVQHAEDNWVWERWAFFLQWRDCGEDAVPDEAGETPRFGDVSLCCWGGTGLQPLQRRMWRMLERHDLSDILVDPFILLDLVFDELAHRINETNRRLRTHVIHNLENPTLASAKDTSQSASFNFVAQYSVMKHVNHLRETCDALGGLAEGARQMHVRYFERYPYKDSEKRSLVFAVSDTLEHKHTLIKSFNLQARSLETRVQKLTDLSFNTVAQRNNAAVIDDSRSMFTIAVVTLLFLPFASIAAMFSTPFFTNNDSNHLRLSSSFWIFWAVTVPMTILVLTLWSFATIVAREQVRATQPMGAREAFSSWWQRSSTRQKLEETRKRFIDDKEANQEINQTPKHSQSDLSSSGQRQLQNNTMAFFLGRNETVRSEAIGD